MNEEKLSKPQSTQNPEAQAVVEATLALLSAKPNQRSWIQWPGDMSRFVFGTEPPRLFAEGPMVCLELGDYTRACHYLSFQPVIGFVPAADVDDD